MLIRHSPSGTLLEMIGRVGRNYLFIGVFVPREMAAADWVRPPSNLLRRILRQCVLDAVGFRLRMDSNEDAGRRVSHAAAKGVGMGVKTHCRRASLLAGDGASLVSAG